MIMDNGNETAEAFLLTWDKDGEEITVPVLDWPSPEAGSTGRLLRARDLIFGKDNPGDMEILTASRFRAEFDGPIPVLGADEWAMSKPELRVNRRAWSLYGRSPVFGPAVLWLDDPHFGEFGHEWVTGPLDSALLETMQAALIDAGIIGRWEESSDG